MSVVSAATEAAQPEPDAQGHADQPEHEETLESLKENTPWIFETLDNEQIALSLSKWQGQEIPKEIDEADPTSLGHAEIETIFFRAKEELHSIFQPEADRSRPEDQSGWDPGVGSSTDIDPHTLQQTINASRTAIDNRHLSTGEQSVASIAKSIFSRGSRHSNASASSVELVSSQDEMPTTPTTPTSPGDPPAAGKQRAKKDLTQGLKRFWKKRATKTEILPHILNQRSVLQEGTLRKTFAGRKRERTPEPVTRECASCMDDVPGRQAINLSCGHSYCGECFGTMITTASENEAQWPPKCCLTPVPRTMIVQLLTEEQLAVYHAKEQEYSVKASDRWYCTNVPACGKFFIPTVRGHDTTTCQKCGHVMCSLCRGPAHARNQRCPQDRNLEATLAIAEAEGWRRCIDCGVMVELNRGCRHITCRCGAEFCYTCHARWRTCRCTEEDQQRRMEELRQRREQAQIEQARRDEEERRRREAEDEEARALADALEQIAAQQRADLEERERLEQEEASKMEESRLLAIDNVFATLRTMLIDFNVKLFDSVKERLSLQVANLDSVAHELKRAEKAGIAAVNKRLDSNQQEMEEAQRSQTDQMARFQKRIKRHIMTKTMQWSQSVGEDAAFEAAEELEARSQISIKALSDSHEEEIALLKRRHDNSVALMCRMNEWRIQEMLLSLDEDGQGTQPSDEAISNKEGGATGAEMMAQRRKNLASLAIADVSWWQHLHAVALRLLSERKAAIISTGADAPVIEVQPPEPQNAETPTGEQAAEPAPVELAADPPAANQALPPAPSSTPPLPPPAAPLVPRPLSIPRIVEPPAEADTAAAAAMAAALATAAEEEEEAEVRSQRPVANANTAAADELDRDQALAEVTRMRAEIARINQLLAQMPVAPLPPQGANGAAPAPPALPFTATPTSPNPAT